MKHQVACLSVESSTYFERHCRVIDRAFVRVNCYRRLAIRDERRFNIPYRLIAIAFSLICLSALQRS